MSSESELPRAQNKQMDPETDAAGGKHIVDMQCDEKEAVMRDEHEFIRNWGAQARRRMSLLVARKVSMRMDKLEFDELLADLIDNNAFNTYVAKGLSLLGQRERIASEDEMTLDDVRMMIAVAPRNEITAAGITAHMKAIIEEHAHPDDVHVWVLEIESMVSHFMQFLEQVEYKREVRDGHMEIHTAVHTVA